MRLILLLDDEQRKLIYAQANKDFIDFLSSLFPMPFEQVLKHVAKSGASTSTDIGTGCLKTLHTSFRAINLIGFFVPTKNTFVNPCVYTPFFHRCWV